MALRTGWELSQTDLAGLVDGWSQDVVSRIERGVRDNLCDIRKLLAFTDAIGMPRVALAPLVLGDPDATLEGDTVVALPGVDIVNMGRREFSLLAAGLAAGAVLPTPDRVDMAHVRYLRNALTRLRAQDDAVGGGAVLAQALQHFDYARRLYEQAALLADSADDGAQRAYLYANMVQQSTCLARYTGRTGFAREALRFADRATDAARHEPSPALHALISLRSSLAHAQVDDEVGFRSAITTARRELDRGPHDADSARTRFVRPSEVSVYEALGKARLGAPHRAVRLYDTVLDDAARSPRDQAYFRSLLAGPLVTAGEPDQAIHHGLTILPDQGVILTSGRVLRDLQPVRDAAATSGADEFCARFDAAARALHTA